MKKITKPPSFLSRAYFKSDEQEKIEALEKRVSQLESIVIRLFESVKEIKNLQLPFG